MTIIDTVNRIYREFKRYTGDGLPGEPTGAALPIGDPQSGPYSPKKSEFRAAFIEILGGTEDLVDDLLTRYLGALVDDAAATAEAVTPIVGQMYFNITVGKFRVWNGVSWQDQSVALNDGDVTEPKHATGGVSTRALANVSVTLAKLAAGAVDDSKVSASAAIAATKLSILQAGTDAVPREVQFFMRNRTPTPLEFHADAALNSTGGTARAANKLALTRALAAHSEVRVPDGILYLPDDAKIPVPPRRRLVGEAPFADGSVILGDGDVFEFNTAQGVDSRIFEGFHVANETTGQEGQLFRAIFTGGAAPEHRFLSMSMGKAARHINTSGILVGWTVRDCTFTGATEFSRLVEDTVDYFEHNVKDAFQAEGLRIGGGTFGNYSTRLISGFREQHSGPAIRVTCASGKKFAGLELSVYFEANATGSDIGDMYIQNSSGTLSGFSFVGTGFGPPSAGQTARIKRAGTSIVPETGGSGYIEGAVPLV